MAGTYSKWGKLLISSSHWPWSLWAITSQYERGLNQGLLLRWSKFGDSSLNRWSVIARTNCSDSKVHGANMRPTWVLSAPDGPHVGPMNLAVRVVIDKRTHGQHRQRQYPGATTGLGQNTDFLQDLSWIQPWIKQISNELGIISRQYQAVNPLRLNVITFAKLQPTKPEGGKCNYIQM